MSTDPGAESAGRRVYVVPADAEDVVGLLNVVDEFVLIPTCLTREEAVDLGWKALPCEFANPATRQAFSRVYDAIATPVKAADETQFRVSGRGGVALTLASPDEADLDVLRALDAGLQLAVAGDGTAGRTLVHEELDEILDMAAGSVDGAGPSVGLIRDKQGEPRGRVWLAGRLHALLALLELSGTEQAQRMRTILEAADPSQEICLDADDAVAYRQLVGQFIKLLSSDPVLTAYAWMG